MSGGESGVRPRLGRRWAPLLAVVLLVLPVGSDAGEVWCWGESTVTALVHLKFASEFNLKGKTQHLI